MKNATKIIKYPTLGKKTKSKAKQTAKPKTSLKSRRSGSLQTLREDSPPYRVNGNGATHLRFIDLFCGIGGFRFAMNA